MYYEKPCMKIVEFGGDELPYTDLIDASGSGNDYPYPQGIDNSANEIENVK